MPHTKARAHFVCDGVDDQVEIQKAIDSLPKYPLGGSVLLSDGSFFIAGPIYIRGRMTLEGQGEKATTLYKTADCDMLVHDSELRDGFFSLGKMLVFGRRASHSGRFLVCNDKLWDVRLSDIYVSHIAGDAIVTQQGWGWKLHRVVLEHSGGNGFVQAGGTGAHLVDCKVLENDRNGIFCSGGNGLVVIGCEMSGTYGEQNRTAFYVKLDCGKDVSSWQVGDSVRNAIGFGDAWTGKIYEVSYVGDKQAIIVAMTDANDDMNIELSDGIENTSKSDTATLEGQEAHRYAGFRSEIGSSHCLLGCKFWSTQGANSIGVYLRSAKHTIAYCTFYGGIYGIYIPAGWNGRSRIIGNLFSGQTIQAVECKDARITFAFNDGYVTQCSEQFCFSYKGGWTTDTVYNKDDVVIGGGTDNDRLWLSKVSHRSAGWANDKIVDRWVDLSGSASTQRIALNHALDDNLPLACDKIFTITPLSRQMARESYWISNIGASTVSIDFDGPLIPGEDYAFQIEGKVDREDWNLTAP